jgi:crossover junction endodeoxyribonuclease RusA
MTRDDPIELVLPYPPSVNRAFRIFRGRAVRSAEAATFRAAVAREAAGAGLSAPIDGPVTVRVRLHPIAPSDAARRARRLGALWHLLVRCIDLDNCLKVALDAIQGTVITNDRNVVDLHLQRREPLPGGALVIRVCRWMPE